MGLRIKLASALKAVNSAGAIGAAGRGNLIDGALGGAGGSGGSFFINKAMAAHMATLPMLYGRKSLAEMLGVGDDTGDGHNRRSVSPSINFGIRKSHIPDELRSLGLELKKDLHNCLIQQQIIAQKTKMPVAVQDTPYFRNVVEPKLKAFNVTDFSSWIPTLNTRFYFEEFEIEPGIERYFDNIPMMSLTEKVPGATNRLKGQLEADDATFTAQYNTQANYTYTAQDCVCHTDISEDLMEDMVPQSGSFDRLRKEVGLGLRRSKEDAIVNGDDSGAPQGASHMDSDVAGGSAKLFNKAFKGLRKIALAAGASNGVDNLGGPIDRDTFGAMLVKMGKMAKEKGDLVWILGASVSNRIVTGAVPELLTLDTFGPNATLVTGNLPRIFGVEPYESEWVREDVNASGVYAAAQVLTTALLVKKSRFVVGQRAPVKIWATPSLANQDKMLLTAKERFTFAGVPQATPGERSSIIAYNISQ